MKIIFSIQVAEQGSLVFRDIVNEIEPALAKALPTAIESIQMLAGETVDLENFSVVTDGEVVVYEIDDRVILAVLNVYRKIGIFLVPIVKQFANFARQLKADWGFVNELLEMRKS